MNNIRRLARSIPLAQRANDVRVRRHRKLLTRLPIFAPNSAGPSEFRADIALEAADQAIRLLSDLAHLTLPPLAVRTTEEFVSTLGDSGDAGRLDQLFRTHGSDKSNIHDYHRVYAAILTSMDRVSVVAEIGLGTSHEEVVSSMGASGRPGASLRAFRDYCADALVYGGDIDERILFSEERISTRHVDQTKRESVASFAAWLPARVNLLIDDGLHAPHANLQILLMGLQKLEIGDWMVIEDIHPDAQAFWEIVTALLPPTIRSTYVRARDGDLMVMERASSG